MKRRYTLCVALVTLLLLPTSSFAARYHRHKADLPAPYLAFFLGVSAPVDTDVTGFDFAGPGAFSETVEFDPSINLGGSAGFDFGFLRLEGELAYKHGEMSTVTESNGEKFVGVDGRVGALSLLFNGFIDVHNDTMITPYFGGGVGFAALHLSDTTATNARTGSPAILYLSDDDTVFAYQAGAGLGIELTPVITLDLGYRYFGTSDATFDGSDIHSEFKLESHNFALGLRFTF